MYSLGVVGYDRGQKGEYTMSYEKLAESTKRIIGENANKYGKENYKQILLKLRPEVVEKFEEMCKKKNVSKSEMFRRLIQSNT